MVISSKDCVAQPAADRKRWMNFAPSLRYNRAMRLVDRRWCGSERWTVRRVAIVGMGIVSAIGNNITDVLASLRQGRSGIELIPERKALGFRSALGGRIKNLAALDVPKRNLRQMGRGTQLAAHAAQQALVDAGVEPRTLQSGRVGVVMGNIGNAQDIYRQCRMFYDKSMKLGGTAMQRAMTDSVSANLSVLLGTQGYALTLSAACATGAATIGFVLSADQRGSTGSLYLWRDARGWVGGRLPFRCAAGLLQAGGRAYQGFKTFRQVSGRPCTIGRLGSRDSRGAGTCPASGCQDLRRTARLCYEQRRV